MSIPTSCRSVFLVLLWGLAGPVCHAQTAQINGSVHDASGAIVPGAEVSALHTETGLRRTTNSNEQGIYTVPLLQPGTYSLSVQKAGFRQVNQSGIRLEIEQAARVDFVLQVGDVTETVQVEASAPLLQVSEASQGQVIANKQIVELPLNGRNYTQLILLSNGAVEPEPGTRGTRSGFSSNGQRSYQNNFRLDGIDNNSNLLAIQSDDFEVIQPNIDALQEFKVQTNAWSAEYGRGAGAVINVAIKSGSNAYHGTLFEFLRNDNIEANNFFNNRAGVPRPEFRQNQFGGTLGGPIKKDRVFFFGDYQGTRTRRASTQNSLVPTAAERRGDFSQTLIGGRPLEIFDPAAYNAATNTRAPFPGNIIPPGRIDRTAAGLAELYPLPNTSGAGTNYISNFPFRSDTDQFDIRGDVQTTPAGQLFGRTSYQKAQILNPSPLPAPAVGGTFTNGPRTLTGHSAVAGYTHIFSPTLLGNLRLGYTRVVADWATTNAEPLNEKYGIRGTPPDLPGTAQFTITGHAGLGDPGFLPNITKANNYELNGSVHQVLGRHDINVGGDVRHVQSTLFTTPQTRGLFNFTGNYTRQTAPLTGGTGLADFLLGVVTSSTISGTSQAYYLRTPFALFVQDSWRVAKSVTLTFGLRYERAPWYSERYSSMANLIPAAAGGSPRLVTPESPDAPGSPLVRTDNINFAPRIGIAWQITPATVVRAGYGIFYGAEEQVGGGVMLHNNPPFNVTSAFTTNNVTPTLFLADGFPAGAAQANPQRPALTSYSLDWPSPYSQQWNFTLERQVRGNILLSLAYIGSNSVHLYQTWAVNAPPPGPGNINDRRPIGLVDTPVFGPILVGAINRTEPRGLANYHSMQVKAEKRYSNGLFLLTSWIWAKAIDYSGQPLGDGTSGAINNPFDISRERARSPYDVRHRAAVSFGYELPFGRGRAFASGLPTIGEFLIGGWQVQGIFTRRSGFPFTVSATGNASNTQSGDRPDVIADPRLQADERSIERWFNTAAFQRQTPFTFGNAGRNILSGPSLINTDLSVFKNFSLREDMTLQFRAEVFNLANRANFGAPGASLGTAAFGTIRSTVGSPRQYQFAMKLIF